MRKRSVRIQGRATSVSLEDIFWDELNSIAIRRRIPIRELVEEVNKSKTISNLSSALRIAVLTDLRDQIDSHAA